MSFRYTHEWSIKASPTAVFRALTETSELTKWFAEGAQVEPRAGGVYRFWGRHTLGTPPQDAARQVITHFEHDALLAFDWPINEVDTDVTLALAPVPQGTTLSLTHRLSRDLRMPRQETLIADYWRIAIGNLIAYLDGTDVRLPDYFAQNPERV
jgi:uncharacterized protein YndB with AHSA1/START domain